MKILYVSTSTDMGGAETSLRSLALFAKKAGHSVKIISLKPLGSVGKDIISQGIEVVSLNLKKKANMLENAGVFARLVEEIENYRPDIVHAILFRAIQFCRSVKKKTPFFLITTPHYDLSKKNWFLRLWDRGLKEMDDISCAESQMTADYLLKKQRYNKDKVCFIANGINTQLFSPNDGLGRKTREKLGFHSKDIVFICVARLSAEKNHQMLLESFAAVKAKNPKIGMILVGDGPENAKLREFVYQRHLEKDVCFVGEVSNVYQYLLASDVFVLASFIESLPISLLEACSCQLPAIVSKVGDMPLVVEHGKTGFVFNGKDPVILSTLMAEICQNENLRKQMGLSARKRIKQKYSCPEEKYLDIYKKTNSFHVKTRS